MRLDQIIRKKLYLHFFHMYEYTNDYPMNYETGEEFKPGDLRESGACFNVLKCWCGDTIRQSSWVNVS